MGRTVVIGIDGADWELLQDFIGEGVVPNIAGLYDEGFHGDLRSIDPPVSVPAWMSFFTGKRPDKLDVYNFVVKEKEGNEIVWDRRVERHNRDAFWNNLEDVGVVGVPTTAPKEQLNGFLVPGPFSPSKEAKGISDLRKSHGYERHVPNMWKFNEAIEKLRNEIAFIDDTLNEKEPEFFIAVTSVTDRLQHSFWDNEEKMRELYGEVDNFVGTVLEHFDEEDNVFLISDHGFADLEKNFYINTWLEKEGFLELEEGEEGSTDRDNLRYAVKRTSKDILSKLGLLELALDVTPSGLKNKIGQSGIPWDKVDYSETKAFAAGNYVGEIYINKEEYDNGKVSSEDYDRIRDEIIEKLEKVEDPVTGEKVVEDIWKKEDIYRDIEERAPDILFYTTDMKYKVKHDLHGKLFEDSVPVGAHGLNGVVLGRGPDIEQGEFDMHLTDVAPTLLHLMDEDVPEDMDGEVQKQIFREGSDPAEREVSFVSGELEDLDF